MATGDCQDGPGLIGFLDVFISFSFPIVLPVVRPMVKQIYILTYMILNRRAMDYYIIVDLHHHAFSYLILIKHGNTGDTEYYFSRTS